VSRSRSARERAANVHGAETLGFKKNQRPVRGRRQGDVLIVAGEDLAGAMRPRFLASEIS